MFCNAVSTHNTKKATWAAGRAFPWSWPSRTLLFALWTWCLPWVKHSLAWKRAGLVRWKEGRVGTVKQVCNISGSGGPSKDGERVRRRFQVLQNGKTFLEKLQEQDFFLHLPSPQELSSLHKIPRRSAVPHHFCRMYGLRKRTEEERR